MSPVTASSTPGNASSACHMSVTTTPGATALTRIPAGPYSMAKARVAASIPPFVAA